MPRSNRRGRSIRKRFSQTDSENFIPISHRRLTLVPCYPEHSLPRVLTLLIVTFLASIAFRRMAQAKGCSPTRLQFYPAVILLAVIIPSSSAQLFLTFAVSHGFCSEPTRTALQTVLNVLCFVFYFGALSRSTLQLKNLPTLPTAPGPPSHPRSEADRAGSCRAADGRPR